MYSTQGVYTSAEKVITKSQELTNINMPINDNVINNKTAEDNYNNLQPISGNYSAVPINALLSSMTANNCPANLPTYHATSNTVVDHKSADHGSVEHVLPDNGLPEQGLEVPSPVVYRSKPIIVSSAIAPANSMNY